MQTGMIGMIGIAIAIAGIGITLAFQGWAIGIQGSAIERKKKATNAAWFGIFVGAFLVVLAFVFMALSI